MTGSLTVRDGGLSTTVQDLGRFGYQSLGLPVSGGLDPLSLRLANALVGNEDEIGALEIRLLGPTFQVETDAVRVALVGTEAPIEVLEPEARTILSGRSATLPRGAVFRIGAISDTGCCYLAVAGGLAVRSVFGSQSTYARGGIGGLDGRALRAGDRLPLNRDAPAPGAERRLTQPKGARKQQAIRVVLGPQADYFTEAGLEAFLSNSYTVSRETDRMGMRLDGPAIAHAKGYNIPSDGIVTGAIQVPGTGRPIILLADRQTTGGYPKIGCVVSADLPRLGRLCPGASIQFSAVTIEEAESLRRDLESDLTAAKASIAPLRDEASSLYLALVSENLISGGEWVVDEA